MTKISGSTFWITGASSGIGKALTMAISRKGGKVIISSRNKSELTKVKSECASPDLVIIIPMDLSDPKSIENAWKEVKSKNDGIDVLINNAGLSQRSEARETSEDVERNIMEVNYFSPVKLSRLVLPDMIKKENGHIVLISSLVGKFGTPRRSSYAASKHALHGYFESLRAEVWKEKIHVTLVCPGYIKTNISVNAMDAQGGKYGKMDQNQLKGKSPESCANAIIKAIEKNKREIYFGGKELLAIYIQRFFPNLLWRIVKNLKVK